MRKMFAPLLAALLAGVLILPASAQDTQPAEALADDNGQFITVDGVQLYLLTEGDPADPAVFFLHGFNASSLTFAEVMPAVAEAGFYAVAVDRPPHGLADRGEDVNYSAAAALPQADYRTYPDVGHMLPDEAPEQFRDDLTDFLSTYFSTETASAQDDISPVPAEQLAGENGQFIEADGANLYVIDVGEPDAPAVLLLHGFGGSTFTWRDNIQPLADAGYRVVAFDRPPYGLADKSTVIDYTNAAYVEQTAALMDILGTESAALVGHSAGGGVIASFALTYPQRVDTLVFVAGAVPVGNLALDRAPTQQQTDAAEQSSPFAALFAVVEQLDPDSPVAVALARQLVTPGLLQDIARNNYYDPEKVSDEVLEGYSQVLRVEGWEGALLKLFTSMNDPETIMLDYNSLADFDAPTLIQWGRQDPTVPLIVGETLADFMPNAQLIIYEETGHLPMEEQIEAFNADLIGFLDSVYTESE